ncbi:MULTISPECIES: EutN/CcmL family microcompartment protein [unclassified Luteococcus]|uniref:EutN/CcmL family microcompartment protein n=1 Tax=unclassified Luteococcus TaxID=2639923 RepID=UPI00313CBAFA
MFLARVVGNVVSTSKDDRLVGCKLLLVQRMDTAQQCTGLPEIAVDAVGAGNGEVVIVTKGSSARVSSSRPDAPIDAVIVGIVDTVEVEQGL